MEPSKGHLNEVFARRRAREFELLKRLPPEFRLRQKEINGVLLIQIDLDVTALKLPLIDKSIKCVQFDVLVDHNFPLSPPKISTLTNFAVPSLADDRDLLCELLDKGKAWGLSSTLFETILALPRFLSRYFEEGKKKDRPKTYGEFHLGGKYDINDWMTIPCCAVFQCQEFPSEDAPSRHLYMVISEAAFLLLEPQGKCQHFCILSVCATLISIERIERDLDTPNKITFYWHTGEKREPIRQELYVEKANHCISYLRSQTKKLGVEIERKVRNKHKIFDAEVTESTLRGINIDKILGDISDSEKQIVVEKFSFDSMQALVALYQQATLHARTMQPQQAVEYYSALGDHKFAVYLRKMKELMKREDSQGHMNESPKDK